MIAIFEGLVAAGKEKKVVDILTLLNAADDRSKVGQMLLVLADGRLVGEIVSPDVTSKIALLVKEITWDKPRIITIEPGLRLFWDRMQPHRRVVIAGGGHISLPLVEVLAIAGFAVTVIDDRPEFANSRRFPQAERVICQSFGQALREVSIDEQTVVVIVTRGHRYDLDCLRAVRGSRPAYLGMIGSQRRVHALMQQLASEGYMKSELALLHAPIGLDIGAETPEEIAISIAAEVVAALRGGSCRSLSRLRRKVDE